MILNTALLNNQKLVVLNDFGCRFLGQDPSEVANIVKEILKERPIYQKKMKIVFAIEPYANDNSVIAFNEKLGGFVPK